MESVKTFFTWKSSDDDDPGTIESIERAEKNIQKKNKFNKQNKQQTTTTMPSKQKQNKQSKQKQDKPPALRDISKLTKEMVMQSSKSTSLQEAQEKAIGAAKKLYELCDVGHKSNREPMVASGQYDVIGPLTQCLLHEPIYYRNTYNNNNNNNNTNNSSTSTSTSTSTNKAATATNTTRVSIQQQEPKINDGEYDDDDDDVVSTATSITANDDDVNENETSTTDNNATSKVPPVTTPTKATTTTKTTKKNKKVVVRGDEKLHFVCLTLNNLSIPHDNKRVMVKERGSKQLIGNLCKVIASGKKEAHLCCIILMNLSFYEPGLVRIGQFSPYVYVAPAAAAVELPSAPSPGGVHSSSSSSMTTLDSSSSSSSPTSANSSGPSNKAVKALATTTTILKRAVTNVNTINRTIRQNYNRKLTPLENPNSLLRILQDLISNVEHGTSDFRWAFGLLANLARHPENALLIGLTGIPRVAIDNLRRHTHSMSSTTSTSTSTIESSSTIESTSTIEASWATNSLEDFSLYFLLHLAEASPVGLKGALEVVIPIMKCRDINVGAIQSLKATMICAFLGLEWTEFPDHGVIAAGAVSELMGNTFERVGKKQCYTDNDFSLRTAVSAYAALAKAAAKADYKNNNNNSMNSYSNGATTTTTTATTTALEAKISKNTITAASSSTTTDNNATTTATATAKATSSSCVHTKVMALPTSIALLFQIINAIALHWGEDDDNDNAADTYHWDIKAGDLAVGAIMSLLPALLEKSSTTSTTDTTTQIHQQQPSMSTQQACLDLSKVFIFFSKKTNSISAKARSAEVAEKLTESASAGHGGALPLLEASYDLCRNYGTHKLQKNFL